MDLTNPIEKEKAKMKLIRKVRIDGECWMWTGGANESGHGRVRHGHAVVGAHRLAYAAWKGPIPDGLNVCHACDRPGCINPDHLWLGTQKDNLRDRDVKGRCVQAVLTADQVADIRRSSRSARALAAQYGVTADNVYKIRRGRTWKHVSAGLSWEHFMNNPQVGTPDA